MEETTVANFDQAAEDLNALIVTAQRSGKPEDRALAQSASSKFFQNHPEAIDRERDLAQVLLDEVIEKLAPYKAIPIHHYLSDIREAFGYSNAPAYQQMVIDWIALHQLKAIGMEQEAQSNPDLAKSPGFRKLLSDAHRELCRYIRTLAVLTRTPLKIVLQQVNHYGSQRAGG